MKTATGFFLFLTGLSLLSLMLISASLEKRQKVSCWPFDGVVETSVFAENFDFKQQVLLSASTRVGRVVVWLLATAVPFGCGVLCFKNEQMTLGLLLLLVWTVPLAFFGFVFWISSLS